MFDDDDAAGLEELEPEVERFAAASHAKIGALGAQRVDDRVGTRFEIAARNSRPHRIGNDGGGQHFVESPDCIHDGVRKVQHVAAG